MYMYSWSHLLVKSSTHEVIYSWSHLPCIIMLLENILITKVALIITGDDHLCNNPLVSCMYLYLFALKYLLNTLVSYIYIYTRATSAFNVCMTCIAIGIQNVHFGCAAKLFTKLPWIIRTKITKFLMTKKNSNSN